MRTLYATAEVTLLICTPLHISIFTGIVVWMRVGGWGPALVLLVVDVQRRVRQQGTR